MVGLKRQLELFDSALTFIEHEARLRREHPRDFILNRAVEIDQHGTAEAYDLPRPS